MIGNGTGFKVVQILYMGVPGEGPHLPQLHVNFKHLLHSPDPEVEQWKLDCV